MTDMWWHAVFREKHDFDTPNPLTRFRFVKHDFRKFQKEKKIPPVSPVLRRENVSFDRDKSVTPQEHCEYSPGKVWSISPLWDYSIIALMHLEGSWLTFLPEIKRHRTCLQLGRVASRAIIVSTCFLEGRCLERSIVSMSRFFFSAHGINKKYYCGKKWR